MTKSSDLNSLSTTTSTSPRSSTATSSSAIDSNSLTVNEGSVLELDEEGHLVDHTQWTPAVAQQLADTLSVTLTDRHYQILQQVRAFHDEFNHPPSTRPLIKYLMKTLPDMDISNQQLQQMFNTGLVARHVNRIAGLPKPPNCL